jgi:DeoR family transcriptional regulator, suf operon transcriptional repressor
MQSTRERVLQTLLKNQRCTINELANAVDINPISVRHHIAKLQSESLVDSIEERHGVGRPRRLYFLTDEGLEQFPTRYIQMSNRLLFQIKRQLSDDDVRRLFSQMAESLVQEEAENHDFTQLPLEDRLKIVSRILINEGFTVEWEKVGDEYHLRETNCPYLQVGQHHPEVCAMDQTLISTVLAVPAEKVRCILDGDAFCTYVIPTNITLEN